MDVNKFEFLVKCKVLPPPPPPEEYTLYIIQLPSHINKKLMVVLCIECAETENQSICNHSVGDQFLSGTCVELQKAVQIGYTLLKVYDVWQYITITKYDPKTGDGGLFAQYVNTFRKIKMEAPFSVWYRPSKKYVTCVRTHEGSILCPYDISFNAGRRAVSKLCLSNIW